MFLEALEEAGWDHLDLSIRSLLPYDSDGNEVMSSPWTASVYGTPPDVPDAILRGDGPGGAEVQAAWDDDVPLDLDDLRDDTQTRARQVEDDQVGMQCHADEEQDDVLFEGTLLLAFSSCSVAERPEEKRDTDVVTTS